MGWGHPAISFEGLMKLIKGFVDILILTSGFQSSGRDAHWDPINITRAFQWALFFEHVLRNLSCLDVYEDSMRELDQALLKMKSSDSFPQGLKHLSSATLTKARGFLVEHFIDTLPLKDSHLRAFMTAVIEMDLQELSGREPGRLSLYLDKLKLQDTSTISFRNRELSNDESAKSPEVSLFRGVQEFCGDSLTKYTIQKLVTRWYVMWDISKIDKSLTAISEKIRSSSWCVFADNLFKEPKQIDAPGVVEKLVGFITWNRWKSKSLCYFLDKRAIRMVSGARLIFSAPKSQWVQVLKTLNNTAESTSDDLRDTVELLLLGCITSRWTNLVEYLMSVSYNPITTSEQYHEVCNLPHGKSHTTESKEETMSLKENDILEYLTGILGGQLRPLWRISPALAAVAIPSWSPLFRLYLSELAIQIRGDSSISSRCCSCNQERKEHNECELAERIWCLYVFHFYGASQTHGPNA